MDDKRSERAAAPVGSEAESAAPAAGYRPPLRLLPRASAEVGDEVRAAIDPLPAPQQVVLINADVAAELTAAEIAAQRVGPLPALDELGLEHSGVGCVGTSAAELVAANLAVEAYRPQTGLARVGATMAQMLQRQLSHVTSGAWIADAVSEVHRQTLATALNRQAVNLERVAAEVQALTRVDDIALAAQAALVPEFGIGLRVVEVVAPVERMLVERAMGINLRHATNPLVDSLAATAERLGDLLGPSVAAADMAASTLADPRWLAMAEAASQIASPLASLSDLGPNIAGVLEDLSSSMLDRLVDLPLPLLPPGRYHGDLNVLLDPRLSWDDKAGELQGTAARFAWVGKRPRVEQALRRRAKELGRSPRQLLLDELQAAIVLVLGSDMQPQFVRLGPHWVKDDDGKVAPVVPDHLPMDWYHDWFVSAVARTVERSLLERPVQPASSAGRLRERQDDLLASLTDPLEDAQPSSVADDPLTLLVARAEHHEACTKLAACVELATPRQRAILGLLARQLPTKEIARRLGISEGTVRVQLSLLRGRLREAGIAA